MALGGLIIWDGEPTAKGSGGESPGCEPEQRFYALCPNLPATIPATEMSSSSSSQRRALPLASTQTWASSSSPASLRRGNFAAGKLISRPSSNSIQTFRAVAHARIARGGVVMTMDSAEVLMPFPFEFVPVLHNDPGNLGKLRGRKPIIVDQRNGPEPKLGIIFGPSNVHMRWFRSFIAEEMEPVPFPPEDRGHTDIRPEFEGEFYLYPIGVRHPCPRAECPPGGMERDSAYRFSSGAVKSA